MRPASFPGWICNGGAHPEEGKGCERHEAPDGIRTDGPWWKEPGLAHRTRERLARIDAWAGRVPVIDAEYTRCAGAAPLADGEYVIEGRRLVVASMPRERAIVDRDPGDEDGAR
jgi:hypothetical protein